MSDKLLKIVKVFLASPGGLEDERQTAGRIVEEINASHSNHWGVQIKLVGWEITLPGYARAQSLINQDLDECDYFIGMLYRHWGSPPADSNGRYSSGFEEEYYRAVEHFNHKRMKDVQLFFKQIPPDLLRDPGESLKKVLEFRSQCINNRKPLFKEFQNTTDFERYFRQAIDQIGWTETAVTQKSESPMLPAIATDQPSESENLLFSPKVASFITNLLKRGGEWNATRAEEIARLRLVALGLFRSGNDEMVLGVHDANLIYVHRKALDLDEGEINNLIFSGVANYNNQNTPIWHWIARGGKGDRAFEQVRFIASVDKGRIAANAFKILRRCGQELPIIDLLREDLSPLKLREAQLRRWLTKEQEESRQAALDHISEQGSLDDVELLNSLRDESDAAFSEAISIAVIKLIARTSAQNALKYAIDVDPDSIPTTLLDLLFERPASLPTEVVAQCVQVKADELRLRATEILAERDAIDVEQAKRMIQDSNAEIRMHGAETLTRLGEAFSEDSLRKLLAVARRPSGLRGFGLLGMGASEQRNDTLFRKYKMRALSRLTHKELKEQVRSSSILEHMELEVLYRTHTKREAVRIRANVDDRFQKFFSDGLRQIISEVGPDSEVIAKIRDLELVIRRHLITIGLTALAGLGDRQDLPRFRQAIDNDDIDIEEVVISYLGDHGDWSDRDRIIRICSEPKTLGVSLFHVTSPLMNAASRCLYKMGRSRLADLLALDMPQTMKAGIFRGLIKKDVHSLADEVLLSALNSSAETLRSIICIKCVQYLSKNRLEKLLSAYLKQDAAHYYNVVHWLDLGIAMPRVVVQSVAEGELCDGSL